MLRIKEISLFCYPEQPKIQISFLEWLKKSDIQVIEMNFEENWPFGLMIFFFFFFFAFLHPIGTQATHVKDKKKFHFFAT
jgi:hypothetical protein